jgi:hypothetical protein
MLCGPRPLKLVIRQLIANTPPWAMARGWTVIVVRNERGKRSTTRELWDCAIATLPEAEAEVARVADRRDVVLITALGLLSADELQRLDLKDREVRRR